MFNSGNSGGFSGESYGGAPQQDTTSENVPVNNGVNEVPNPLMGQGTEAPAEPAAPVAYGERSTTVEEVMPEAPAAQETTSEEPAAAATEAVAYEQPGAEATVTTEEVSAGVAQGAVPPAGPSEQSAGEFSYLDELKEDKATLTEEYEKNPSEKIEGYLEKIDEYIAKVREELRGDVHDIAGDPSSAAERFDVNAYNAKVDRMKGDEHKMDSRSGVVLTEADTRPFGNN